ncbi:MAG: rod shape-determining protein MreD [Bacteroidia bacterium]
MNRAVGIILLLGLQIIVLNHLEFSSYLMPQVFVMILIGLPPYIKRSYQVLIGFALGLFMDFFNHSPGLHASAAMFTVMLRLMILQRYDLEEIVANRTWLNLGNLSLEKYGFIAAVLTLFYHMYAIGLELIGALNSLNYLLTVVLSSLLAFLLILLFQFLFSRKSV